eukprot:CAMPEP_0113523150 /NCGR_PEP_ID=MMETSP0014_2-20120614/45558_1 /TAXON_ID=2857 /ORGANISM="Nitzschia sp." /LENGTH=1639 /DNA_ID=CAMNT_0000421233 /DNA_START=235 /DNA_END=5154 /DNA_ORIENTATION=- /assembly_acc=CAM_ASM_000159
MSTLEALAFNVLASTVVGVTALVGFELAVVFQKNNQLAPRTSARPRSIIRNVLNHHHSRHSHTKQHSNGTAEEETDALAALKESETQRTGSRSLPHLQKNYHHHHHQQQQQQYRYDELPSTTTHNDGDIEMEITFSDTKNHPQNADPFATTAMELDSTTTTTTSTKDIWRKDTRTADLGDTDDHQQQQQQHKQLTTPTSSSSATEEDPAGVAVSETSEALHDSATTTDDDKIFEEDTVGMTTDQLQPPTMLPPSPSSLPSQTSSSSSYPPLPSDSTLKTKPGRDGSGQHTDAGDANARTRVDSSANNSNIFSTDRSDDNERSTGDKTPMNDNDSWCRRHLPYCLSWIPWALNLTYLQLMEGIPGTGTRDGGWSGPTLKCNLDGIVLLKFHSLCLKVSILATVLCLGVVLPINYTAPCNPDIHGAVTCQNITQLTDFESTTLAHIPPVENVENDSAREFFQNTFRGDPSTTMRLLAIVACAYIIYTYACVLIWEQWIECLALRRAYYLECNHYEGRQEELQFLKTLKGIPEDPIQDDRAPFLPHPELRETVPNIGLYSVLYKLPSVHLATPASASVSQVDQQLSAATEFFDKIAPNQPGYSSSVAAVTVLPEVRQVSIAWKKWFKCAAKLRRLRFIRKQLKRLREGQSGTIEVVFDHDQMKEQNDQEQNPSDKCSVPAAGHYPSGKSSDNDELNPLFHDHSEQSKNTTNEKTDTKRSKNSKPLPARTNTPRGSLPPLETVDEGSSSDCFSIDENTDNDKHKASTIPKPYLTRSTTEDTVKRGTYNRSAPGNIAQPHYAAVDPATTSSMKTVDRLEFQLHDSTSRASPPRGHAYSASWASEWGVGEGSGKEEFLASVGLNEEVKLESFLSEYDVEQLTVYSREFARTSAMCCPYGCDEYAIRHANAEKLVDMEIEAEEAVREATEELRLARAQVNRSDTLVPDHNEQSPLHRFRKNSQEDSKLNLVVGDGASQEDYCSNYEDSNHQRSTYSGSNLLNTTSIMSSTSKYWEEAQAFVEKEHRYSGRSLFRRKRKLSTGEWVLPIFSTSVNALKSIAPRSGSGSRKFAPNIVRTDSYAVVTFTSRQAAIAARQCLADGSGLDRWLEVEDIPTPSLADAPPWDIFNCRGCCRPVTLTLPQEQKRWRQNFVIFFLVLFCFLYTIPLTAASSLVTPDELSRTFPDLVDEERLSGFLTGLLYTAFFSICPQIFKMLSNFGSGATSVLHAETSALRYYWIFMLATAFTGTSLATVIIEGVYYNFNVAEEARDVLRQVASTIPTTVGSTWLNWLIIRYSVTMPTNYLLQFPTLAWRTIQFKCCARMTAGGGPGGPVPYRIYVDSGVAFLCVIGLAPVCPLVAPAAMIYFLVVTPIFRWLLIFSYRPQFDGGGFRWPHLHNIFITAMLWSQFLLSAMMALKKAWVATIFAGLALIPTYTFSLVVKDRFETCYRDAALLQTSELDGWDNTTETSMHQRETYRRWLVDCHRAAYVPVCVNGDDNFLTAEPAVVIPSGHDHSDSRGDSESVLSFDRRLDIDRYRFDSVGGASGLDAASPSQGSGGGNGAVSFGGLGGRQRSTTWDSYVTSGSGSNRHQRGATFRRVGVASPSVANSTLPPIPTPNSFAPNRNRTMSGSVMFSDPIETGSTKSA